MAWRSSGTTNDEMVDNLTRFGVISSMAVENAFRNVDRAFFVPENDAQRAYADQPLKDGNVHLSAPHIYGSVLESFELEPNTSGSFLNAGSGSGYLTCLAASIMGPRSSYYCVEIHEDVVEHSVRAIENWKEGHPPARAISHIDVIHGNALEIDPEEGEASLGFDRIYVGAAIGTEHLPKFKRLLKPGGILVGPVEDELLKVVRNRSSPGGGAGSAAAAADDDDDGEFSQRVVSGVRFAPLVAHPSIGTVIPARVWNPSIHGQFPASFRTSCKALLLCSNAEYDQPTPPPRPPPPEKRPNVASMLPKHIWMEIVSYTHRDWFKTPESEVEMLRRRLKEERERAEAANLARLEAEARCHQAQRERDVHQLLARRWKSRLLAQLGGDDEADGDDGGGDLEGAAVSMLFGAPDDASVSRLLRHFRVRTMGGGSESEEEEEEEEEDGDEEDGDESLPDRQEGSESLGEVASMEEDDDDDGGSSSYAAEAEEPPSRRMVHPPSSSQRKLLGESSRTVTTLSSSSFSSAEDGI